MKKNFVFVLTIGVFSILNTEMGIVGILPAISGQYGVSLTTAGLLVSLFALAIAIAGPVMPMLMSRFERKKVMIKVMMGVSAGMVLGAPVAGLIVNWLDLRMGLLFFAIMNLISLIATILYVPEFPKAESVSYGTQLGILKEKKLWLALVGVIFLNGSIFGVYSYVSAYLEEVVSLPVQMISVVLFVYGLMNIVGNTIAGKGLSANPNRFISVQPVVIGAVYLLLLLLAGALAVLTLPIVFVWGISAGMVANTIQYWVTSAAPGAPEFANGLYLTAANLGISAATPFCGFFITGIGTQAAPVGGILLVVCTAICIYLKVHVMDGRRKVKEYGIDRAKAGGR